MEIYFTLSLSLSLSLKHTHMHVDDDWIPSKVATYILTYIDKIQNLKGALSPRSQVSTHTPCPCRWEINLATWSYSYTTAIESDLAKPHKFLARKIQYPPPLHHHTIKK